MDEASAGRRSRCLARPERMSVSNEEEATTSALPIAASSARPAASSLSNAGAGGRSLRRIAGSLSTVYLLLHVHVLPQQQQQHKKKEQQQSEKVQLDSAAISNGLSAALLQHAGLLGATLLPFKVLSYDARLSFAIVKTDAASAPSLILAAANVASLNAAPLGKTALGVPCFVTLVRAAALNAMQSVLARQTLAVIAHRVALATACPKPEGADLR
ncbi:hypothetical protein Emag_001225 [Eimeria magna]